MNDFKFCRCGALLTDGDCLICWYSEAEERQAAFEAKCRSIERNVWAETVRGMAPADPFGFADMASATDKDEQIEADYYRATRGSA